MERARPLAPAGTVGDEFDRLKTLLFKPESQKLSTLEQTVGALDQRVGTPDRLEKATAEVLVQALRRAEVAQHRELADAMAPMVVAAIRNEINNSKDMMVEALYPITGRLVSAGIAVAIAELAASINQRMDSLLSVDMLKLRFQAWRTGRPLSELALARLQHGTLVRLLYLERGSGQLLGQWQADHGQDERADLISGMIAALTDFARNALGAGGGDLRTLDIGDGQIYLRTSAQMIVAAQYQGEPDASQQRTLDTAFLDMLDRQTGSEVDPQHSLETLAAKLSVVDAPSPEKKKGMSPLATIGLLLLAGMGYWGWVSWRHWQADNRIDAALAQTLAARPQLAAYPVHITTSHSRQRVALSGLVPSQEDEQALQAAIAAAAAPYKTSTALAVVTTQPRLDAVAAANATLEKRLAGLNGETRALESRIANETSATRTELADRLQGEISVLSSKLTQYYIDLNTTRAKLSGEAGAGALALHGEIEAGLARLAGESAAIKAQGDAQFRDELATLSSKLAGLSGETGAGALALHREIEAGLARLASQTADIQAQGEAHTRAEMAGLRAILARMSDELAATRTSAQENSRAAAGQASQIQGALSAEITRLQDDLKTARLQLADEASAASAASQQAIEALRARLDTPRARLEEKLRGLAIFFSGTDTLEDEAGARTAASAIAPLANAAGGIRVVGYSDETGTPSSNRQVSRRRAEVVAQLLREAGANPARIVLSSRAVLAPLTDPSDPASLRNRRVTFEPLYDNEIRP